MKETKNLKIIIISVVLFILIILAASSSKLKSGDLILKTIDEILTANKSTLIFLGNEDSQESKTALPVLNTMATDYNFIYKYIGTEELTNGQIRKIMKKLKMTSDLKTPHFVIVNNGKIAEQINGMDNEEHLFKKLKENKIIDSALVFLTSAEKYKNINFLTYPEYVIQRKQTEKSLLIIGQKSCSICEELKELLNTVATSETIEKININYIEITEFSDAEKKDLFAGIDYFKDKEGWPLPLSFVMENNSVTNEYESLTDQDKYIDYLQDAKLIIRK